MVDPYDRQDRGDAGAYDRYLRQMDASMRQKVALTAAHLLCEGELADMGMGSGGGSHALASLYPGLTVFGVDVNPVMVERARRELSLPNLRFVTGDVAAPCFEPGTLEAILDSSVLHHVTSFNGYDRAAAARALEVQVAQLAPGGVLVVRDFVDPGPGQVWLDLPADDGDASDDPRSCSTAALLRRFAREFRALRPPGERGFPLAEVAPTPVAPGLARFELAHAQAAEFLLRKDYRDAWEVEAQEEYLFATQRELEDLFARLGLRVLASTPIRNPWIVEHRFRGKARLARAGGEALDWPATNHVIVGQKVAGGQGVGFVQRPAAPVGYLRLDRWRRVDRDQVLDLVRRPHATVDVLPWFRRGGAVHVLARRAYPRPILASDPRAPLDGSAPVAHVTEPLVVQLRDEPLAATVERSLAAFPDLGPDAVLSVARGGVIYPSPGGLQERVEAVRVEVRPVATQLHLEGGSGFSTSGELRAIEARQLLRAAQVGGLPDARLELHTYDLLLELGLDPGEWIGEAIPLALAASPPPATPLAALLSRPRRRAFRPAPPGEGAGFLELVAAEFVELDAGGAPLGARVLERVVPARHALDTLAAAVLVRDAAGRVLLGVEDDDRPAAQAFEGHSELLSTPAWRLPREVRGIERARAWLAERLREDHGVEVAAVRELGGRYHPSAGVTAERVHPLAVEVRAVAPSPRAPLAWVPLEALVAGRQALRDGHLRIAALRAAHALGLLVPPAGRGG